MLSCSLHVIFFRALQLMDLNTWFNVQQAAIQSILSPESMAKDAISDYLKVG